MSNIIEVKVPDIGDVAEVDVIEVLVAEGDTVAQEQSLITVESDKASMEIPSTAAGVVKLLKVKVGDKVSEGSVILELADDASASAQPPAAAAPTARAPDAEAPAQDRKSTRLNSSHVRISYAVFCLKKKKTGQTTAVVPA